MRGSTCAAILCCCAGRLPLDFAAHRAACCALSPTIASHAYRFAFRDHDHVRPMGGGSWPGDAVDRKLTLTAYINKPNFAHCTRTVAT